VEQITFTTPNTPIVEAPADVQSRPTNSIAATSTKKRGTINGHPIEKPPKQDKNPLSITLVPHQLPDSSIHPLLTLYPTSRTTAVEWRDALRFLVGLTPGQETEDFTMRLADVGVRVKLLDIVAGGVDIPRTKPIIEGVSTTPGTAGRVSITGEFWYDSMVD
jgi:hypothetical protein